MTEEPLDYTLVGLTLPELRALDDHHAGRWPPDWDAERWDQALAAAQRKIAHYRKQRDQRAGAT